MKIALCLLTYNEVECLKIIFPKIGAPSSTAGFDSIHAVDGGSTDGSLDFFRTHGVQPLIQKEKGRGKAIMLAIENIQADAIIFFSPDGNENVLDLKRFREFFNADADLIIASRMVPNGFNEEDIHWWRPRKWTNLGFNFLANVFFNRSEGYITDSINGYRAIRCKAAETLRLTAADYTIEYQMTIQAMKKNLKIVEFPTHEGQRVAGKSRVLSFPAGMRFVKRFALEAICK